MTFDHYHGGWFSSRNAYQRVAWSVVAHREREEEVYGLRDVLWEEAKRAGIRSSKFSSLRGEGRWSGGALDEDVTAAPPLPQARLKARMGASVYRLLARPGGSRYIPSSITRAIFESAGLC